MKTTKNILNDMLGLIFEHITSSNNFTCKVALLKQISKVEKNNISNDILVSNIVDGVELGLARYFYTQLDGAIEVEKTKIFGELSFDGEKIFISKNNQPIQYITFENIDGFVGGYALYQEENNTVIGYHFLTKKENNIHKQDITINIPEVLTLKNG